MAADWLPAELKIKFTPISDDHVRSLRVELTEADIDVLSSCLAERLASVGFDGDYQVNSEGATLENLTDRLGPGTR